jgi:hypothetical protein
MITVSLVVYSSKSHINMGKFHSKNKKLVSKDFEGEGEGIET